MHDHIFPRELLLKKIKLFTRMLNGFKSKSFIPEIFVIRDRQVFSYYDYS